MPYEIIRTPWSVFQGLRHIKHQRKMGSGKASSELTFFRHGSGEMCWIQNPVATRAAENEAQNRRLALSAPFCPRAFLLSAYQSEGWLVGAVGIENNTGRSLKDLEGILGNANALKRNNEESSGILIGPSMAPRSFFSE
jgi:hypothetical protein